MAAGTVLVTGGAKRIGRAIVRDFAGQGWAVAIHYGRSREEADALAAEIRAAGGRAATFSADLARESEVAALLPRAATELGPVTCLVNNASVFEMDKVDTATRESWDRHIETNLRAPLVLSQALARQLPDGAAGNIVNLLDQRVWKLTPYFLSYTVAKSRTVDPHANAGARAGTADSRQRDRAGTDLAQHAAKRRSVPPPTGGAAFAPRRHARGDRRRHPLHPGDAFLHRTDAGARWRRASRLGAAEPRSDCVRMKLRG